MAATTVREVNQAGSPGTLSVVVVAHDMVRELPRTLWSLSPRYQVGLAADDYEVIVVDNGSSRPVDPAIADSFDGTLRVERLDPAPPSPAHAANVGLGQAEGDLVGLIIDGARLASPGLLAGALRRRPSGRPTAGHGPRLPPGRGPSHAGGRVGYDQAAEDQLLSASGWEEDGYRLFEVSTPAASSGRGLFGPMGEIELPVPAPPTLWNELGGLDERFALPGGGLVNHDLYRRACGLEAVDLVVLLGEGTFHQYHGGAATSRRHSWDAMHEDYLAIRGHPYEPPRNAPIYVGTAAPAALPFVERSARQAIDRSRRPGRPPAGDRYDAGTWTTAGGSPA